MNSQLAHDDSIDNLETGQTDCVCVCFRVCLTTRILIDTDNFFNSDDVMTSLLNKKLSYCWETVRRESMPRIAEMDVEMTT